MDVFSHGLWPAFFAAVINGKIKNKLKIWQVVLWGVFPDVLAFSLLFSFLILRVASIQERSSQIFGITSYLYSLGHSLIIFGIVFILACLLFRKIFWEMLAWLSHILIDIPTHSFEFYPTPFLWPISQFKFDGWAWGNPRFIIINYSLLAVAYIFITYLRFRKRQTGKS